MKTNNFKGRYRPKNPDKYEGNANQIIFRSSWERLLMVYCDKKDEILRWSSEELSIPYVFEGKNRSYYPDFWIEFVNKNSKVERRIVEIKPDYQRNWGVNKAKWSAATKYAQDNEMSFQVMTEKELF